MATYKPKVNRRTLAYKWLITMPQCSLADEAALKKIECRYLCYGIKKAAKSKYTAYMYMEFNTKVGYEDITEILPRKAHMKPAWSDKETHKQYCSSNCVYLWETGSEAKSLFTKNSIAKFTK